MKKLLLGIFTVVSKLVMGFLFVLGTISAWILVRTLLHDFGIWALPRQSRADSLSTASLYDQQMWGELLPGHSVSFIYFALAPLASLCLSNILFRRVLGNDYRKHLIAWLCTFAVFVILWFLRNPAIESQARTRTVTRVCEMLPASKAPLVVSPSNCQKLAMSLIGGDIAACVGAFDSTDKRSPEIKAAFCNHLRTLENTRSLPSSSPVR